MDERYRTVLRPSLERMKLRAIGTFRVPVPIVRACSDSADGVSAELVEEATSLVLLPAVVAFGVWMLATGQHTRFLFLDPATDVGRAIFAVCLVGTVICTCELAFRAPTNIPDALKVLKLM